MLNKSMNNRISAVRIHHFAGDAVQNSNEIEQCCKSQNVEIITIMSLHHVG